MDTTLIEQKIHEFCKIFGMKFSGMKLFYDDPSKVSFVGEITEQSPLTPTHSDDNYVSSVRYKDNNIMMFNHLSDKWECIEDVIEQQIKWFKSKGWAYENGQWSMMNP